MTRWQLTAVLLCVYNLAENVVKAINVLTGIFCPLFRVLLLPPAPAGLLNAHQKAHQAYEGKQSSRISGAPHSKELIDIPRDILEDVRDKTHPKGEGRNLFPYSSIEVLLAVEDPEEPEIGNTAFTEGDGLQHDLAGLLFEASTSVFREGRRLDAPRVRGVQLQSGDEIHVGEARIKFETA